MKNAIKFIAIAILVSISIFAVNAQEQTVIVTNEGSTITEKVEKKNESTKKRQSNSDDDSWTGFYVGGYGGYNDSRANPISQANLTDSFSQSAVNIINSISNQKVKSNSFNGGGTFGYNYQKGKLLIGGEFDFGGHKFNKQVVSGSTFGGNAFFTITQSVKSNWVLTARPRAGVALKKVLIYATGGLAVTNIKYAENFNYPTGGTNNFVENSQFSKAKAGWTVGAGLEFKVARRWSVKGEYLFNQSGRASVNTSNMTIVNASSGAVTPFPGQTFTQSTDLKSHSIRFGVNYRF